jgi:precorrin-6B methylase 2
VAYRDELTEMKMIITYNQRVTYSPSRESTSSLPRDIEKIIAQLRCTDLRPGPRVNGLFQELVALALATDVAVPGSSRSWDGQLLAELYDLCACGETRLESHWARLVADDPGKIHDFPYLDNYVTLSQGELLALNRVAPRRVRTLAFVGAGPMPLTALAMGRCEPGLRVTCIDRDPDALSLGRRVVRAVRPAARLRFLLADAVEADYSPYDAVLIAALVGVDREEKATVMASVAETMRKGSLLAVRSVPPDGRRLLYPRIEPDDVPGCLDVLQEWIPAPGVINSLVVMAAR